MNMFKVIKSFLSKGFLFELKWREERVILLKLTVRCVCERNSQEKHL